MNAFAKENVRTNVHCVQWRLSLSLSPQCEKATPGSRVEHNSTFPHFCQRFYLFILSSLWLLKLSEIDFPKNQTKEFVCFLLYSPKILETWNQNYMAKNKNKFFRSLFGKIYGVSICFQFYLTFRSWKISQKDNYLFSVKMMIFFKPVHCDIKS